MLKGKKPTQRGIDVKNIQTQKWLQFGMIAALCTMFASSAFAFGRYKVEFDGDFTDVVSSGPECDGVFSETEYHTQFHLVGPTRRTLVSNFRNANDAGLFHAQNFVSLFGYNGDFLYEKTVRNGDEIYNVTAEGFVDQNVVYIEFNVEREDVACTATATYAGFN
jgi:hypothetical protein